MWKFVSVIYNHSEPYFKYTWDRLKNLFIKYENRNVIRIIKQNQEDEFKHSVPNLWTQIWELFHTTLNLHVQYIGI
jgi:hypothetical protein